MLGIISFVLGSIFFFFFFPLYYSESHTNYIAETEWNDQKVRPANNLARGGRC